MSNFIKRIAIWFLILIVAIFLVNYMLWNHWINENGWTTFRHCEEPDLVVRCSSFLERDSIEGFTNLFFGSSRIYRHVNPVVFDSLLNDGSRSYNLGFRNLFPFRLYDIMEVVISNKRKRKVNVFIELAPLAEVKYNYKVLPIQHSITYNRLKIGANYLDLFRKNTLGKEVSKLRYYQAFIWKYFSPELIRNLLQLETNSKTSYRDSTDFKGFFALDWEATESYNRRQARSKDLNNFVDLQTVNTTRNGDDLFLNFMVEVLNETRNHGVENIYFIIPPRIDKSNAHFIASAKDRLEKSGFKVFDFSSQKNFPELYNIEFSFDRTHLNKEGADIFTMHLVNFYKQQSTNAKGQPIARQLFD